VGKNSHPSSASQSSFALKLSNVTTASIGTRVAGLWEERKDMITIQSILCPIDLSPESDTALRYGIALARAYEAKLLVCHCLEATPLADESEVKKLLAHTITDHIRRTGAGALNWEAVVRIVTDKPASGITQEAGERNVDLIVMQSRRRPRAAVLLGSTAEAVCHTAPCPVLVTHPREREWVGREAGEIKLERVLVAHDFSAYSAAALSFGILLAEEYEAELHLMHVLPPRTGPDAPEYEWLQSSNEDQFQQAARRLKNDVPAEVFLWCEVKQVVREGKPAREILSYAEAQNMDLICLGGARGAGSGLRAILGEQTDRVLRRAPCPVLVARPIRSSEPPRGGVR
jgi:nucleotide-binding universal stress UspA family protein